MAQSAAVEEDVVVKPSLFKIISHGVEMPVHALGQEVFVANIGISVDGQDRWRQGRGGCPLAVYNQVLNELLYIFYPEVEPIHILDFTLCSKGHNMDQVQGSVILCDDRGAQWEGISVSCNSYKALFSALAKAYETALASLCKK